MHTCNVCQEHQTSQISERASIATRYSTQTMKPAWSVTEQFVFDGQYLIIADYRTM